jgi:hypothetical protein
VNLIEKAEPSILTFTDWGGRQIGDHPQDIGPPSVDDDDDSAGELISDVIPEDPAPEDDAELPGVDTNFDVKPTGVEVDSGYAPNKIHTLRPQRNQAPIQPLCQLKTLQCLAKEWQHTTPGQGNLLRSTSQP